MIVLLEVVGAVMVVWLLYLGLKEFIQRRYPPLDKKD